MSRALLREQYSIMIIRVYVYGVAKWGFILETNNIFYYNIK